MTNIASNSRLVIESYIDSDKVKMHDILIVHQFEYLFNVQSAIINISGTIIMSKVIVYNQCYQCRKCFRVPLNSKCQRCSDGYVSLYSLFSVTDSSGTWKRLSMGNDLTRLMISNLDDYLGLNYGERETASQDIFMFQKVNICISVKFLSNQMQSKIIAMQFTD